MPETKTESNTRFFGGPMDGAPVPELGEFQTEAFCDYCIPLGFAPGEVMVSDHYHKQHDGKWTYSGRQLRFFGGGNYVEVSR